MTTPTSAGVAARTTMPVDRTPPSSQAAPSAANHRELDKADILPGEKVRAVEFTTRG